MWTRGEGKRGQTSDTHTIELSSRSNVIWNTRKNFDDLPWFSRYITLIPVIYFEFIQLCFCSYSLQDWKLDRCNKNRARTFIGFDENDACEGGGQDNSDGSHDGRILRQHPFETFRTKNKKKRYQVILVVKWFQINFTASFLYYPKFIYIQVLITIYICACVFSLCLFFNCSSIFGICFFFLVLSTTTTKKTIPHPLPA